MRRFTVLIVAFLSLVWVAPAWAQVTISFHSYNGSLFGDRYPHAFFVLEGTVEETGEPVDFNYGFSAESESFAVFLGPVKHMLMVETEDYLAKTNRHFSVPITDEQYYQIMDEVRKWRDYPGKYYDVKSRNCIQFTGRMGEIIGLNIDYPRSMQYKPKAWLTYIEKRNPGYTPVPRRKVDWPEEIIVAWTKLEEQGQDPFVPMRGSYAAVMGPVSKDAAARDVAQQGAPDMPSTGPAARETAASAGEAGEPVLATAG